MKYLSIFMLISLSSICFGSEEVRVLQTLELKASEYRVLAIECAVDLKLSRVAPNNIPACNSFFKFIKNEYPALKSDLVNAENLAKKKGESLGLNSKGLRQELVSIMAIRSDMNIAGKISNAVIK